MSLSEESVLRHAIPLVNEIQDFFARASKPINFDLPQIVVVGSQSAGKSSVLENFVGREFLPRGSGIVTRRPLILQLVRSKEEFAEFIHRPGDRFKNFDDVRREIEEETERLTGKNKGISDVPINLKVYSPSVLDLTLVDLPGMIRIPVGDQPEDIEQHTKDMIMSFIENENSLILAVTPANTDIATSDAIKLARSVDPDGRRTIGVLSKLDLMDEGTDARDILENKTLPLKRGYIGVVNRSQKDIDGQKSLGEALKSERSFFKKHHAYRHMANRHGTPFLQKYLNEQLTHHIKIVLPVLRANIQESLVNLDAELKRFHEKPESAVSFNKLILSMSAKVKEEFEKTMGDVSTRLGTVEIKKQCIGHIIKNLFEKDFQKDTERNSEINEVEFRRTILTAIQNTNGLRAGFFTPAKAFETVIQWQVERLVAPCHDVVEKVFDELKETIRKLFKMMSQFPVMERFASKRSLDFLEENTKKAKSQIDLIIDLEKSYMETKHKNLQGPEFNKDDVLLDQNIASLEMGGRLYHDMRVIITRSECQVTAWAGFSVQLSSAVLGAVKGVNGYKRLELFPEGRRTVGTLNKIKLNLSEADSRKWFNAFVSAGFYFREEDPWVKNDGTIIEECVMSDSSVVSQVELVRQMVREYMEIVVKTLRSIVPKIVVAMIIDKQIEFFTTELPSELLAEGEKLHEEDPSVGAERQASMEQIKLCKNIMKVFEKIESIRSEC
ncbi:hypothetical protein QR680_018014 [Steinernema hermaphroditum]|uniref:dynamin GTPase n=1 Tax=Steinernema hermaphroditum TaxID=289476 RepID=A0AA39HIU5_9BILA|nr:hypothetical protein QR680_018014 [Steinernema hermaphroditum]